METVSAIKAGKPGRNGFDMKTGKVVHAVPPMPSNTSGFWGDKALCGTEPGRRGYGWIDSNQEITCKRCLKKIEKNESN